MVFKIPRPVLLPFICSRFFCHLGGICNPAWCCGLIERGPGSPVANGRQVSLQGIDTAGEGQAEGCPHCSWPVRQPLVTAPTGEGGVCSTCLSGHQEHPERFSLMFTETSQTFYFESQEIP